MLCPITGVLAVTRYDGTITGPSLFLPVSASAIPGAVHGTAVQMLPVFASAIPNAIAGNGNATLLQASASAIPNAIAGNGAPMVLPVSASFGFNIIAGQAINVLPVSVKNA